MMHFLAPAALAAATPSALPAPAQNADPGGIHRNELELALTFYREVDAGAFLREAAGIPVA